MQKTKVLQVVVRVRDQAVEHDAALQLPGGLQHRGGRQIRDARAVWRAVKALDDGNGHTVHLHDACGSRIDTGEPGQVKRDHFSDLVSRYEQAHHAIEPALPKGTLRFLMEARGLKPEDLSSIVPQSNLSAILPGKRKISATLAGKLGKVFGISAAVFVPA